MKIAKPGGTREQDAVAAWLHQAEVMRPRFAELAGPAPALVAGYDALSDAVARLGECELHARALDRCVVLRVFPERRPELEQRVAALNADGVRSLEQAEAACQALGRDLAALKIDREGVRQLLSAFEGSVRRHLAEWEMKGSDAERLMGGFSELVNVVLAGGPEALGDWIGRRVRQLAQGRQEPGRGTHENMPWWKWMFLVGFVGWMLAGAIIYAAFSGSWSAAVRYGVSLGWSTVLIVHLIAYALFC